MVYSDIIDATSEDGFLHNTGVQSKSYRWVSKSRVESVIGKTSPRLLDEIDFSILKDIPSYKKEIAKYKYELDILQNKYTELQNRVIELENKWKTR